MKSDVVEIKSGKVWIDENGIFHHKLFPGQDVTLDEMIESFDVQIRLSGGKRTPFLVDIRGIKSVSREARAHVSSQEVVRISSVTALVVDSPMSRVIGNFFMGLNKPPFPVRLFTSEEKALEWLKTFVEQEGN